MVPPLLRKIVSSLEAIAETAAGEANPGVRTAPENGPDPAAGKIVMLRAPSAATGMTRQGGLMDEDRVKEIVNAMRFFGGKRDMSLDELAMVQPGLARIMPEIGARTWKLYYAVKAQNWPLAIFQWKETKALFELGAYMRPKHEAAIEEYLRDDWATLEPTLKAEDSAAFFRAFDKAIDSANAWHEKKEKPYIRWKVPDFPPPDLDMTPRKK
jgi:hypothetical protein